MKYLPTASTQNAAGLVTYAVPAPQDENQWIGRLDYTLSSRHNVFARYFMTNYYQNAIFNGNLLNAINPNLNQLGFDYIHQELNLAGLNTENGQFTFNGSYAGTGLADLLLGAPNTFNQGFGPGAQGHLRYNYFGYFAQDTWHATHRLAINAGLRWEPWFPEYEKNNVGGEFSPANFSSNTVSSVYTNAPAGLVFYGDKGVNRGFISRRLTNFSPRVGFAFDPSGTGKQSLRASYTLTFEAPELYYDSGFPANAPYASAQSLTLDNSTNETDAVKSFDNPWKKIAGGNPFPTQYPPSSTVAFSASNISTQIYPTNLRRTYMHQYNASYQYQASPNWLLSVSYIGTSTIHLWAFQPSGENFLQFLHGVARRDVRGR